MNLSSQFQVRTFTRTDPEYWVGTTFGGTVGSLPETSAEWTAGLVDVASSTAQVGARPELPGGCPERVRVGAGGP